MVTDRWFGAGFESFFLGDRLERLWAKYWWRPNEAHNGYPADVLELGWVGIGLLVVLIASAYRHTVAAYRANPAVGAFKLAIVAVAVVYNMTEAAFKVMHPVLIVFLLAATAVPEDRATTADEATRGGTANSGPPLRQGNEPLTIAKRLERRDHRGFFSRAAP